MRSVAIPQAQPSLPQKGAEITRTGEATRTGTPGKRQEGQGEEEPQRQGGGRLSVALRSEESKGRRSKGLKVEDGCRFAVFIHLALGPWHFEPAGRR